MVWAIRARDSKWKGHNWRQPFQMTFDQSYGNALLPSADIPKPASKVEIVSDTGEQIELNCLKQTWDDFVLDSCYDSQSQELVFRADLPNNSWLSIGFGSSMTNTDMIGWFASSKRGSVKDFWSTENSTPS